MTDGSFEMPIRNLMELPEWYESLDPGIRFPVKILHAKGIETGQSCEGGKGHAYDRPSIDLGHGQSQTGVGFAALAALLEYGLPVASISYMWTVDNGLPFESFWRIVFSQSMHASKDAEPSFICQYRWNEKA